MEVLACATAQQLRRNCENFLKDEQGRRIPSRPPVLLQEPLRGGTLPQLVGNLALPVQTERELSRYKYFVISQTLFCRLINTSELYTSSASLHSGGTMPKMSFAPMKEEMSR